MTFETWLKEIEDRAKELLLKAEKVESLNDEVNIFPLIISSLDVKMVSQTILALVEKLRVACEALEFYADRRNAFGPHVIPDKIYEQAAGHTAREALGAIGKVGGV